MSRQVGVVRHAFVYQWIYSTCKDFDSTGRVYEQYLRKWITHFRSAVSEESPLHVSVRNTQGSRI